MARPPINRFRTPETHHVTNIFVDLSGSTAAGEKLNDNQRLFELLDRWQRLTAFNLCAYGGRIGASDSDMVMGYFEGFENETLASSRAILAAKKIRDETIKLGEDTHVPLDVHIGIHCGDVEEGFIGPEIRRNETTIAPPVNIAARLESKAHPGEIFVSEQIKSEAKLLWEVEYVEEYTPKGVTHPVKYYRVNAVGFSSIPDRALNQPEWVFATIEAQALEQIGKDAESLALAKIAASSPNTPGLSPALFLIPQETCIWTLMSLNQPIQAEYLIHQFMEYVAQLSAQPECARASFYLGECLASQKKYAEAITAYGKAMQGYERCGNRRGIADSLFYAGVCFQRLGNSEQAAEFFAEAKKEYLHFINYQKADDVEIGKACLELSILLANDPGRAIDILALAQKKFKERCQFRFMVRVLNNLSCIYNRMRIPTDAENYARRALDLARDFDPINGAMEAFVNIGISKETKIDLGMISRTDFVRETLIEARDIYQEALKLALYIGNDEAIQKTNQYIDRVNQKYSNLNTGSKQ